RCRRRSTAPLPCAPTVPCSGHTAPRPWGPALGCGSALRSSDASRRTSVEIVEPASVNAMTSRNRLDLVATGRLLEAPGVGSVGPVAPARGSRRSATRHLRLTILEVALLVEIWH